MAHQRLVKTRAKGLPRLGKKPYPPERQRQLISTRILPATKEALERIGADNLGRAIDSLVAACSQDGMAKICPAAREMLQIDHSVPVTRI